MYTLWGAVPHHVMAFVVPAASGTVVEKHWATFLVTDLIPASSFLFWSVPPAGCGVSGRNPRHGGWLPEADKCKAKRPWVDSGWGA